MCSNSIRIVNLSFSTDKLAEVIFVFNLVPLILFQLFCRSCNVLAFRQARIMDVLKQLVLQDNLLAPTDDNLLYYGRTINHE